ncbi:MAG: hypothetical protein ACKVT0_21520 [Planctomycetaceae bacterium]
MASWQLELQSPPQEPRALELWLQHAAGRILFEDVRAYAADKIDPLLSAEAKVAAQKAIDDALYGVMMVLDGVTGALSNEVQQVEFAMQVRLVNRDSHYVVAQLDLGDGDGMCMGYHGWLQGDYGDTPIVSVKAAK